MIDEQYIYWMAMADLPRWRIERVNNLLVKILKDEKISLQEFYSLSTSKLSVNYELTEKEINDLLSSREQLPNYSFLVEDLLAQGYKIIPINSDVYPQLLKKNLKLKASPPVLYAKGNTQIFKEKSVAIVGSRDASPISLDFTDTIAKNASLNYKVVVSGFAKGVDKQALDSAIKYTGQSIIVLPQGIMTYASGFNKYYKQVQSGDVLVISTFHPKAGWSAGLAMARNPIIYGLAEEIYVAQSADSGGTWQGVLNGLSKGRTIYVRYPQADEDNANLKLIKLGAVAVDMSGKVMDISTAEQADSQIETVNIKRELTKTPDKLNKSAFTDEQEIALLEMLSNQILTAAEIRAKLSLEANSGKISSYLKKHPQINTLSGKPNKFKLKTNKEEDTLF
jgi:DNA processing protein